MKNTLAFAALLSALTWSTAAGAAVAPLIGVYTSVKQDPVIQFNHDGTKQQIGTSQSTRSLELNADGTLRTSFISTYGNGSKSFNRGVWMQKDGLIFFIGKSVTVDGKDAPNGSTDLGAQYLRPSADGITSEGIFVMPLLLTANTFAKRTSSAELGAPVSPQDVADLREILDRIVRSISRPAYAGVASEDELKAIVHRAVAARDVDALLRVSYPTMEGLIPDVALDHYIEYMTWLALPGTPTIRDEDSAAATKQLTRLKTCCGCSFPATMSPRGGFWIGRKSADGRDQSAADFYYGIVDGKWAIIGSPLSEKAVAEKKGGGGASGRKS